MTRQISTLVGASTLILVFASSPASADFRLERQPALSPGQTLTVDDQVGVGDADRRLVVRGYRHPYVRPQRLLTAASTWISINRRAD